LRYIEKGPADAGLIREPIPRSGIKAKRSWERFKKKPAKKATLTNCLGEQFFLCGYSEVELNKEEFGYHIEHIKPKKQNPTLTFEHTNLIISAIDDANKRKILKKHVFGGHAKHGWNNEEALIHPLKIGCSDYFVFEESTGLMSPNPELPRRERAKARLTIYKLNLNSPALVPKRKNMLNAIRLVIDELLEAGKHDDLESFAKRNLLPDGKKLVAFHSANKQIFGRIADKVMK